MEVIIIRADGTGDRIDIDDRLQLSELQRLVGGLIEFIPTTCLRASGNPDSFVCNEESKLLDMPINLMASAFADLMGFDVICGDAVIVGPPDNEGRTTECDLDLWERRMAQANFTIRLGLEAAHGAGLIENIADKFDLSDEDTIVKIRPDH